MRAFRLLLAATILTLTISPVVHAHGGAYVGPAGEVPPNGRPPTDPQPPPDPNRPTTGPGQPGEATEPPDGGTPTDDPPDDGRPTPRPPSAPDRPGIGGPAGGEASGGRKRPPPMAFTNWLFWWHHNKPEFLDLEAALRHHDDDPDSGSSPHFFGGRESRDGVRSPTDRLVDEKVVPALLRVAGDDRFHPDIRSGALVALARTGAEEGVTSVLMGAARREAAEHMLVQESAVLALGIHQEDSEEVRDFLIGFADDPKAPVRARCFALYALGLLADDSDETWHCLKRRLAADEANQDLPVSALVAIGLVGDGGRVEELLGWLESGAVEGRKLSRLERAWLVSALGRIGDPRALPAVSRVLFRKGLFERRSAAIAMGQLLPAAEPDRQVKTVGRIAGLLTREKDLSTANFLTIALGRIGGAKRASGEVRRACVRLLLDRFRRSNRTTERPFAALALGVLAHAPDDLTEKSPELRRGIAEELGTELAELKGDRVALGALAVALGLTGDRDKKTLDLLTRILRDRHQEPKLRGAAAVALGLIGDRSSREPVLSVLDERESRNLRIDTAVAAGLLGDRDAVGRLVNAMGDPKASQFVLGSIALALGQIGDARAIPPLLGILETEKPDRAAYPDLTRALVTVALGQIADRRDTRVLYRISKDVNYRASVPALREVLSIL